MSDRYDVLIVGAGHAGAQGAIALRAAKYAGTVALLGDEPELPYERPPLSKDYLAGARGFERLLIRPAAFWAERAITLLPGRRVTAVDAAAHQVTCADGARIGYRKLLWATGGAPRRLSCTGHDMAGVHHVRTRADVDAMAAELPGVARAVVIGGGYVGLEAAAVLRKLGREVVLVEAHTHVLARVAGEDLSRFIEGEHRAHGVDLRLGATVACIEERDGRATGVRLTDGELLAGDMVIVGVGITPAVEPLLAAGAEGGNGVRINAQGRTSLSDIWAAGDCALHANRFAGGAAIRLESVQNANDQASVAAKDMAGLPAAYDAVPWFWSEQYDLRLQTVGLSAGHNRAVTRGDPASRSFSVVYLRDGRVAALDCVNAARDYAQGRALVAGAVRASPEALADSAVPLKSLLGEFA